MAVSDYCTVSEIKAAMPDGNWGSSYDTILGVMATRASRAIDLFLGRKPGAFAVGEDETRYYDGNGEKEIWVDELAAAPTSVAVAESGDLSDYTVWGEGDYIMWPYNALLDGRPYLRIDVNPNGNKVCFVSGQQTVKVIGKFGYSVSVPEVIKQATIVQATRWFKRGQQAFEDTGAIGELGQLRYVQLDPEVMLMVEHLGRVMV